VACGITAATHKFENFNKDVYLKKPVMVESTRKCVTGNSIGCDTNTVNCSKQIQLPGEQTKNSYVGNCEAV
jgi:hypothetical protein